MMEVWICKKEETETEMKQTREKKKQKLICPLNYMKQKQQIRNCQF